ncbi:MAG TPA: flagellar basal body rod protein FlgC [Candidatus Hydrogenedentes bacterium]|nr:flagellar basal body rod protein FlgC [Candidatus Hydrogenedentota bacterium]HNT87326.1 flagellar basal body rod protein FlgC [Candidatus Hydrogenedentota bacterium]
MEQVSAREIAVSGLRAQRTRMNVIANNIANATTTRTPEGGAFRRQMVILRGEELRSGSNLERLGVEVKRVAHDPSPFRQVFQPGHPDADAGGYVSYPNVNLAVEMVDLVAAQRAYEANVAVLVTGTRMHERALEIISA